MSDDGKTRTVHRGGIGFVGLLTVVLIGLKLGPRSWPVAGWSWWWVLAPLWIYCICMTLLVVLALFLIWLNERLERKERERQVQAARDRLLVAIAKGRAGTYTIRRESTWEDR